MKKALLLLSFTAIISLIASKATYTLYSYSGSWCDLESGLAEVYIQAIQSGGSSNGISFNMTLVDETGYKYPAQCKLEGKNIEEDEDDLDIWFNSETEKENQKDNENDIDFDDTKEDEKENEVEDDINSDIKKPQKEDKDNYDIDIDIEPIEKEKEDELEFSKEEDDDLVFSKEEEDDLVFSKEEEDDLVFSKEEEEDDLVFSKEEEDDLVFSKEEEEEEKLKKNLRKLKSANTNGICYFNPPNESYNLYYLKKSLEIPKDSMDKIKINKNFYIVGQKCITQAIAEQVLYMKISFRQLNNFKQENDTITFWFYGLSSIQLSKGYKIEIFVYLISIILERQAQAIKAICELDEDVDPKGKVAQADFKCSIGGLTEQYLSLIYAYSESVISGVPDDENLLNPLLTENAIRAGNLTDYSLPENKEKEPTFFSIKGILPITCPFTGEFLLFGTISNKIERRAEITLPTSYPLGVTATCTMPICSKNQTIMVKCIIGGKKINSQVLIFEQKTFNDDKGKEIVTLPGYKSERIICIDGVKYRAEITMGLSLFFRQLNKYQQSSLSITFEFYALTSSSIDEGYEINMLVFLITPDGKKELEEREAVCVSLYNITASEEELKQADFNCTISFADKPIIYKSFELSSSSYFKVPKEEILLDPLKTSEAISKNETLDFSIPSNKLIVPPHFEPTTISEISCFSDGKFIISSSLNNISRNIPEFTLELEYPENYEAKCKLTETQFSEIQSDCVISGKISEKNIIIGPQIIRENLSEVLSFGGVKSDPLSCLIIEEEEEEEKETTVPTDSKNDSSIIIKEIAASNPFYVIKLSFRQLRKFSQIDSVITFDFYALTTVNMDNGFDISMWVFLLLPDGSKESKERRAICTLQNEVKIKKGQQAQADFVCEISDVDASIAYNSFQLSKSAFFILPKDELLLDPVKTEEACAKGELIDYSIEDNKSILPILFSSTTTVGESCFITGIFGITGYVDVIDVYEKQFALEITYPKNYQTLCTIPGSNKTTTYMDCKINKKIDKGILVFPSQIYREGLNEIINFDGIISKPLSCFTFKFPTPGDKDNPSSDRLPSSDKGLPHDIDILPATDEDQPHEIEIDIDFPSDDRLPSSSDRLVPSSDRLPPSSDRLIPSSDRFPPSSDRLSPSSDRLAPSSDKDQPHEIEIDIDIPSDDRLPSSSDRTPPSSDKNQTHEIDIDIDPSSSDRLPSSSDRFPPSSDKDQPHEIEIDTDPSDEEQNKVVDDNEVVDDESIALDDALMKADINFSFRQINKFTCEEGIITVFFFGLTTLELGAEHSFSIFVNLINMEGEREEEESELYCVIQEVASPEEGQTVQANFKCTIEGLEKDYYSLRVNSSYYVNDIPENEILLDPKLTEEAIGRGELLDYSLEKNKGQDKIPSVFTVKNVEEISCSSKGQIIFGGTLSKTVSSDFTFKVPLEYPTGTGLSCFLSKKEIENSEITCKVDRDFSDKQVITEQKIIRDGFIEVLVLKSIVSTSKINCPNGFLLEASEKANVKISFRQVSHFKENGINGFSFFLASLISQTLSASQSITIKIYVLINKIKKEKNAKCVLQTTVNPISGSQAQGDFICESELEEEEYKQINFTDSQSIIVSSENTEIAGVSDLNDGQDSPIETDKEIAESIAIKNKTNGTITELADVVDYYEEENKNTFPPTLEITSFERLDECGEKGKIRILGKFSEDITEEITFKLPLSFPDVKIKCKIDEATKDEEVELNCKIQKGFMKARSLVIEQRIVKKKNKEVLFIKSKIYNLNKASLYCSDYNQLKYERAKKRQKSNMSFLQVSNFNPVNNLVRFAMAIMFKQTLSVTEIQITIKVSISVSRRNILRSLAPEEESLPVTCSVSGSSSSAANLDCQTDSAASGTPEGMAIDDDENTEIAGMPEDADPSKTKVPIDYSNENNLKLIDDLPIVNITSINGSYCSSNGSYTIYGKYDKGTLKDTSNITIPFSTADSSGLCQMTVGNDKTVRFDCENKEEFSVFPIAFETMIIRDSEENALFKLNNYTNLQQFGCSISIISNPTLSKVPNNPNDSKEGDNITTQPTTESTTQPTTQPTTESTTQPTTESTTESTTQPTTQPTIQPTIQLTTEPSEDEKNSTSYNNQFKKGGSSGGLSGGAIAAIVIISIIVVIIIGVFIGLSKSGVIFRGKNANYSIDNATLNKLNFDPNSIENNLGK